MFFKVLTYVQESFIGYFKVRESLKKVLFIDPFLVVEKPFIEVQYVS